MGNIHSDDLGVRRETEFIGLGAELAVAGLRSHADGRVAGLSQLDRLGFENFVSLVIQRM